MSDPPSRRERALAVRAKDPKEPEGRRHPGGFRRGDGAKEPGRPIWPARKHPAAGARWCYVPTHS